jgi:hypothetical protein
LQRQKDKKSIILDLSDGQLGFLGSAFLFAYMLLSPLFG